MSVDVLGRAGDQKVVIEYDGSYFHKSECVMANDKAKTLALLDAGYVVVRLRENDLPVLEIDHPRLYQSSFRYRMALDEAKAARELSSALRWIERWPAT